MPTQTYAVSTPSSPAGQILNIFGDLVTIKVASQQTNGKLTVIHSETPPNGGPPLHAHLSDSETFFVLEGEFLFVLNDETVVVSAGSTVFIPAGTRHQYQNVGGEPGKLLIILEPAGLDAFFIELDVLLKQSAEPDMPAVAALHAKFGMELLGPPLAALG